MWMCRSFPHSGVRRCRKGVDDEQPNDRIVHLFRLRKTDGAVHQPFDLRLVLANLMLFSVGLALMDGGVSVPLLSVSIVAYQHLCDTFRLSHRAMSIGQTPSLRAAWMGRASCHGVRFL